MAKRKLDNGGHKTNDDDSPKSVGIDWYDYPRDDGLRVSVPISNHRTCWLHMMAFMCRCGLKMRKEDQKAIQFSSPCFLMGEQKLGELKLQSPWFLPPSCVRKRSERRIKEKEKTRNAIREKEKLIAESLRTYLKDSDKITKAIGEKRKLDTRAFDTYFDYVWESFAEEKRISFTYLESIWFSLYTTKRHKAKVLTWIKRKEIFSKKYVIVPIVIWDHWSLLIFCHLGESFESKAKTPCMLLLDSLEVANPKRFEPVVRRFLLDIYRSEGRDENKMLISQLPFLVPKVPQQRNGTDCGNYVLYFIKLFVQFAPDNFSIDGYPYFMNEDWFTPECLERFLEELDSKGKTR